MGWFDNFVPVTGWPGGVVVPVDPSQPIPGGTIAPTSLDMTTGEPFSQQFVASGGTAPYTWSVSGTLPGDLVLAGDTIAGSDPGSASTAYFFVVRATDSTGDYIDQLISGTVQAPAVDAISPTSIKVTAGTAFSQQFTASGGTAPYTWSITSGALPAGLSLASDTISGTPGGTAGDTYSFTIRATDSFGNYVDQPISGTVQAPPAEITYVGGVSVPVAFGAAEQDVTLPSGIVAGDLILVFMAVDLDTGNSLGVSTPGYSLRATAPSSSPAGLYYWSIASGGDTLTVVGPTSSREATCVVQVFRGVDNATPFDVTYASASASSGSPNCSSITTVSDGAMVVAAGLMDDASVTSVVAPSGFGNLNWVSAGIDGEASTVMVSSSILATAGTIDPGLYFTGASDGWYAITDALRPA